MTTTALTDERFALALVGLADTLTDELADEFDTHGFLNRLTRHFVELLDVPTACAATAGPEGRLTEAGAHGPGGRDLRHLVVLGEPAPCADCLRTGAPLVNIALTDEDAEQRWPAYTKTAVAHGHEAATALPLTLRGQTVGAVTFFHRARPGLDASALHAAHALARAASVGLFHQRAQERLRTTIDQLQHALSSRVAIEQAKGMLAERRGLSPAEAFELLRGHARAHSQPLRQLALAVVSRDVDVPAPALRP